MSTYYDILGISENATKEEIKRAYRQKSLEYHPDRNRNDPNATNTFQKISEAHSVLSDENQRRKYDLTMKGSIPNGMHAMPDDIFNIMAHFMNNENIQRHATGVFNIQRTFNKPPPIEIQLQIDLEKAYMGYNESVVINRIIIQNGIERQESETLYIPIPKGADNGEILLIENKGHITQQGLGDVKIFFQIINKSIFIRKGLDLIYTKDLSLKDALCGFSFEINHINGKSFTINNKKGNVISPNFKKIIPELGMQRGDHVGNLIVNFNILFPQQVDIDIVEQLEKLL